MIAFKHEQFSPLHHLQVVSVLFHEAHTKLLLPGFAVYHNADTVEEHKDILLPEEQRFHSSEASRQFAIFFSKRTFDICLSSTNAWTIEKWHIKASLRWVPALSSPARKHRVWVGEEQIELPGGQVIGPDPALENKEFVAVLTINNHEKLKIRCRIHHLEQEGEAPKVPPSSHPKVSCLFLLSSSSCTILLGPLL